MMIVHDEQNGCGIEMRGRLKGHYVSEETKEEEEHTHAISLVSMGDGCASS